MIALFNEPELLKQDLVDGLSVAEIARKYNCSFGTVKNTLKRFNIEFELRKNKPAHNRIDMTGKIYGCLTVLEFAYKRKKVGYWKCQCACGKICYCHGPDLRHNKTKTCGCRISLNKRTNWQGYEDIGKRHWQVIINNANQRNIEFSLTIEEGWELYQKQNKRCALSGVEIYFGSKALNIEHTASLDRIDSSKTYTKDNVQWIHKDLNMMKWTNSQEKFIDWCRKVTNHADTRSREEQNNSTAVLVDE